MRILNLQLIKSSLLILIGIIIFSGCKKYIEVEAPYTSFNGENVYTTDATAISAVTAMYTKLGSADGGVGASIPTTTYPTGLSADELILFPGNSDELGALYRNELNIATAPTFWLFFYQQIYLANAAIEGLSNSNSLTPAVKKQLLGESKFMRAFCYFYLVNLYGDIPLVITTNYKINSLMPRTPAANVWQQILADLLEAKELLNEGYVESNVVVSSPSTQKVRPNKATALALLSRAYLFNQDWSNSEAHATEIINNKLMYDTASLFNAFLNDPTINKEAIWQIQTTTAGWNTNDARVFVLPATGPNTQHPFYLNKRLVNSFDAKDKRLTAWINYVEVGVDTFYYAYKYKNSTIDVPVTEYFTVLRLSEQYLIRAEARAQQNNISGAQNDLNIILARSGLENTAASTKDELINEILNERRYELFCEWGHRWLDLKRTNTIDSVMNVETSLKGGTWQTFDKFYPIPLDELTANPNLTQTPGY